MRAPSLFIFLFLGVCILIAAIDFGLEYSDVFFWSYYTICCSAGAMWLHSVITLLVFICKACSECCDGCCKGGEDDAV